MEDVNNKAGRSEDKGSPGIEHSPSGRRYTARGSHGMRDAMIMQLDSSRVEEHEKGFMESRFELEDVRSDAADRTLGRKRSRRAQCRIKTKTIRKSILQAELQVGST